MEKRMIDYVNIAVGLGGALFGGLFREVIDRLWVRADKRIDAATQLREELWEEIRHLREQLNQYSRRIDELEAQGNEWREKYFELLYSYTKLEGHCLETESRCEVLEREVDGLRTIVAGFRGGG